MLAEDFSDDPQFSFFSSELDYLGNFVFFFSLFQDQDV